jgi:histidine triad (HIT) family protein
LEEGAMTVPARVNDTDRRAECTFCRIIERQIPACVIDEDDAVIVFLSLGNHPMVVPKKHIPDLYAMDDETGARVMAKTIQIAKAVKRALRCDGIYLTQTNGHAAGQDVFHFHLHVYPCWDGQELEDIVRFARSVAARVDASEEARASTMHKIRAALAAQ